MERRQSRICELRDVPSARRPGSLSLEMLVIEGVDGRILRGANKISQVTPDIQKIKIAAGQAVHI